jgi:exoribonuclease II
VSSVPSVVTAFRVTIDMPQLSENEIAFFRYRNRLLAGVCVSSGKGKVRLTPDGQGPMNVPAENILLATGVRAGSPKAAAALWEKAEAGAEELDLSEVWDLVRDETDVWGLEELAELCYGEDATMDARASLLLRLESGDWFAAAETGYRPLTAAELDERKEAAGREAERQARQELFENWFRGKGAADLDDALQADWVSRLKDYVLHGPTSAHARWVERMAGQPVSQRKCFDRVVHTGAWSPHEHLDLYRDEVPTEFSPEVLAAADGIELASLLADPARRDLQDIPVFTVDDEETKDIDDGLSVVFHEDGSATVGVHITDVASLVPKDSVLDREASHRVSSLYFPDARFPMLPGRLSSDLGSLVEQEPRLALSVMFPVDADGALGEAEVVPAVVRSVKRLSYDEMDAILEDRAHRMHSACKLLRDVAEGLLAQRLLNGAVAIQQPDLKFSISEDGTVAVTRQTRNSPSSFVVSEMMVLANVAMAEFCRSRGVPTVFRTQYAPDLADLQEIENEVLYRHQVLRRMQRAAMSMEPGPHGGLGVEAYCQASSPLRRYGDLSVQRQIVATVLGQSPLYDGPGIQEVIFQAEERTRQVRRLERRRERYWLLRHLEGRVGETFEAVVLECRDRDVMAELLEFGIRIYVKGGARADPGTAIPVRLGRSDPWEDDLSFTPDA